MLPAGLRFARLCELRTRAQYWLGRPICIERPPAVSAAIGFVGWLALGLACGLADCSSGAGRDDPDAWYNKTIIENMVGRTAPAADIVIEAPPPFVPTASPAVVPPNELYRSDDNCRSASSPILPAPATLAGDIALEMTECEVARRAGSPDKVDLSMGPHSERLLTLSYLRGPHPRTLYFTLGRLTSIENLQEANARTVAKPKKR